MKKPQGITPEIIEWVSDHVIGDEEEPIRTIMTYEMMGENRKREIRNELRREQERKLRDL